MTWTNRHDQAPSVAELVEQRAWYVRRPGRYENRIVRRALLITKLFTGKFDPHILEIERGERLPRTIAKLGDPFDRDHFEPQFAPAREGEVERTALDTFAAAERLGWRAERTLETGLRQTVMAGA